MSEEDFSYLLNSLEDFFQDAKFSAKISETTEEGKKVSILTTVGLTGDKVGFLTLSMDDANGISISEHYAKLMGIPINSKDLSDHHIEALLELTNQISGRVVMFMEENSINCSITPPSFMSGGEISLSFKTMKHTRKFKISGDFGHFHITIGIK